MKYSFRSAAACEYILASTLILVFAVSLIIGSAPVFAETVIDPHNSADIEKRVREYFSDVPVMIAIAKCESGFRQFDSAGNVLDGGAGAMMGVFQIHEHSHRKIADTLGLDFHTLEGNLAYARHLYENEGTDPWISAFPCWDKGFREMKATGEVSGAIAQKLSVPAEALAGDALLAENSPLTAQLTFGMVHSEVKALQELLNKAGFLVAEPGTDESGAPRPGSPGHETTKFGNLTRDAVRRFQCAQKIVCTGDEFTTSYGVVGPRTRAALAVLSTGTATSADVAMTKQESLGAALPVVSPIADMVVATDANAVVDMPDEQIRAKLEVRIAELRAQIDALLEQINQL